jgi:hypothetical protein
MTRREGGAPPLKSARTELRVFECDTCRAIAQLRKEREILFHTRAVQLEQRRLIRGQLHAVERKLAALTECALKGVS